MPSVPVHDFRVFTPPSFTRWRYNSDRYESVRLPRYGNLASCTSSEQSAQAMELFVVPKSMPRAPLLVLGVKRSYHSQFHAKAILWRCKAGVDWAFTRPIGFMFGAAPWTFI